MREQFGEALEVTPALMTLEAVLSEGLASLPRPVRKALERDDYSQALSAANAAYSSRGPDDREAALAYAVLLVGRQLIDEARGVLQRALTHHAQDVGLQLVQAEALVMDGDFDAAKALLDALQSVTVAEPRHWAFVGDLYLDMGDEDDAVTCYRRALEEGHESPEMAFRMAQIFDERGDEDGAAHYLEIAARYSGDNPALWQVAAEALYEVGRVEDAISAYEALLAQKPQDHDAWFMLGLSHWILERYAEAADAFEKVVDLHPRHRGAWRQLGAARLAMGHAQKALDAFRKALEINPDDLDVLNAAVMAAYDTGDVELAIQWAERAMDIAPQDPQCRYNYAVILLTLGRGDDARELLEPVVEAGEGHLGKYLGALAVAELMEGKNRRAFEHIGEAERLGVEAQWLAAFAEELLKSRGADETMDYLDRAEASEPLWEVVRPLLGYICSGLAGDDGRAADYADEFQGALRDQPQVVPVLWDFDSWEAFAFQLERRFERVFDAMLAVVEGRREPEDFGSELSGPGSERS